MSPADQSDKRKRAVWNVLLMGGLFAAGLAAALYFKPVRIQPVELPTLSGEKLALPGKGLTWVNFWSVSCPPCMEEMPYLDKLHHEYKGKVNIVGVSAFYDPPDIILNVRDKLKLTLPLALDMDQQASLQFPENTVVPSHYLLDGSGKVLLTLHGTLSEATIREAISPYL